MLNGYYSEKLIIAANQNLKEKKYWQAQLAGELEKTTFYYDNPASALLETEGDAQQRKEHAFTLPEETSRLLIKLSNQSDVRLHMILTAALVILLQRCTGSDDIIVGTTIYKQDVQKEFINTILALRNRLEPEITFKDLLLQVRQTVIQAVEHQNYPIGILLEQLKLPMEKEFPLFDIAIVLENIQEREYLRGITTNMNFYIRRIDGEVTGVISYNPRRYCETSVCRIGRQYSQILATVLQDVNQVIYTIDILSHEELKQLLEEFNTARQEIPGLKPFHKMIEDQVEQNLDKVMVVYEHSQITYKQLLNRSEILARELHTAGVVWGSVVAIMANRSTEMILGVMGIIKSGGAYLPLSPENPAERNAFMLKDSNTPWLVTQEILQDKIPGNYLGKIVYMNHSNPPEEVQNRENPGNEVQFSDLVYVIYTSGSTGKPKGVVVQHDHFVNVGKAWQKEYRLNEIDVNLLQMANFTFDVFAGDLARTFLNGGRMVINPLGGLDPEFFYTLINKQKISLLESTPSYIIPFMDYVYANRLRLPSLKLLILGSDTVLMQDFKRLRSRFGKQMRIVNSYGVTEATIDSSYYEETEENVQVLGNNVPIGKPFPNMEFYILDQKNRLQPVGVPGELCIGGASVTCGYLNNPTLTAEKFDHAFLDYLEKETKRFCGGTGGNFFKKSPLAVGDKIYRTGDLARWRADGNVEFLGRSDNQIKIRGYRIELGEIENKLLEHPHIKEAVIVQKEDRGDKYLCGYFTAEKLLDASEIREFLGNKLPDYMVPWFFVQLERIPLTPNRKIDRKALPEPETQREIPYIPPRDRIETGLVDIWSQALGVEKEIIGIDTSFFDLGGNSLKAIVTTSKIHKVFDVKMQLTEIFALQTIREIARQIKVAQTETFSRINPVAKKEHYPLASAQKRLYILQRMEREGTVYNMPNILTLSGELEIDRMQEAVNRLIQRHESLRTSFHLLKGEPVQKVHEPGEITYAIENYDMKTGIETGIETIIKGFIRPFDLSVPPLLRIGLIRQDQGTYIFMADTHHIISDGTSQNILVREVIALYKGEKLPPLRLQYRDYTQWINTGDESEDKKGTISTPQSYWLAELAGPLPVLDLPTDYPRPEVRSFEGTSVTFVLGEELTEKTRNLAAQTGATLFMVLLAAINVLLSRCANQEDIVVGTVTAGRNHPDLEQVIGMFVNTLPLRNFPAKEKTFREFIEQVKVRALKAFENQGYPFENLIEKLHLDRDTSRNPLFDVMFTLDNISIQPPNIEIRKQETVSQQPYEFFTKISKFDLTIQGMETVKNMSFMFEYCTRLFEQDTIGKMCQDLKKTLEVVGDNPGIKIKEIPFERGLLPLKNTFPPVTFNI